MKVIKGIAYYSLVAVGLAAYLYLMWLAAPAIAAGN